MYKIILVTVAILIGTQAEDCVPRSYGADSFVCVCNATYCDTTPDEHPAVPDKGKFYWYLSDSAKNRLFLTKGDISNTPGVGTIFDLDRKLTYQEIIGWGGAFTDAAGINIKKLSNQTQDQLLKQYFDKDGSRYTIGRIPIGGTDFSTRPYTYDDMNNDFTLKNFSLAYEDYHFKIPLIQKAMKLSPEMIFFGSCWGAPAWMKTNHALSGVGFLKPEFYQTYSEYLLKFIDSYSNNGIPIWAITTGNEPSDGIVPGVKFNSMGWFPNTMSDWVANNLGPTLKNSKYNQTIILALDDQRFELPWFIDELCLNNKTKEYISGTAVHWYWDNFVPPEVLDETHDHFPDKFLLMTEACTGDKPWEDVKVVLGSWYRAELYILDIIQNINHWVTGWVDWNIALDRTGGPNWASNFVDSPIIVQPENDEFYKQPMYYAIKHVSRFVNRGSSVIAITGTRDIKAAAFSTPDNKIVAVLYNTLTTPQDIVIKDPVSGHINVKLTPKSISTIIYRQ